MKPASDIKERVFTAADKLFEHDGRATFPTVDAVRKAALASELWQAAQTSAAESLVVAQSAWDTERQQMETINKEMADGFELQLAQLDATHGELRSCSGRASSAMTTCELMRIELEALRARLTTAEGEVVRKNKVLPPAYVSITSSHIFRHSCTVVRFSC